MGNSLKKENFPYDIGEQYGQTSIFKLHKGISKSDKGKVTIFMCPLNEMSAEKIDLAKTTFRRMKSIMHPNFIKFLDGVEFNDVMYIVTEYVEPLSNSIHTSMLTDKGFQESISWGTYQIIQGLSFLHSKHLYHGHLSLKAVYVTDAGNWKIGELGFCSEINQSYASSKDDAKNINTFGFPLKRFYNFLEPKYRPPELISQKWDLIEQYPEALDSWGMGCLFYEIYEGNFDRKEQLKSVSKIPGILNSHYRMLITDNPTSRSGLNDLENSIFYKNSFIDAQLFLEQIALKDQNSIDTFLIQLTSQIDTFPKNNCKFKILPELVKATRFGSCSAHAVTPIFKIGKLMNEEEYKEHFIPLVLQLFETETESIRIGLFKNMDLIALHLALDIVEQKIYPILCKGFMSTNPAMREVSVIAITEIAGKINSKSLEEEVIKHLWALQADKEPAIRTNTVIALGKLAKHLSEKTRSGTLLHAFARSLRDPFVHSRVYCIKALIVTKDLYKTKDIATKVLPVVSPLTIDPQSTVRDLAFQCLETYIQVLQTNVKSPSFEAELQASQNARNPEVKSNETPDGWTNWALSGVSNLKKKFIDGEGSTPPSTTNTSTSAINTTTTTTTTIGGTKASTTEKSVSNVSSAATPKLQFTSQNSKPSFDIQKSKFFDDPSENVYNPNSMDGWEDAIFSSEHQSSKKSNDDFSEMFDQISVGGNHNAESGKTSFGMKSKSSITNNKTKKSSEDGWENLLIDLGTEESQTKGIGKSQTPVGSLTKKTMKSVTGNFTTSSQQQNGFNPRVTPNKNGSKKTDNNQDDDEWWK